MDTGDPKTQSASPPDTNALIKRLKQGLMTGSPDITTNALGDLFALGSAAVKPVQSELRSLDLKTINRPELIGLATGLATILHDLDEDLSTDFLNSALQQQLNPVIAGAFRSILKFSKSNFRMSQFGAIEILEDMGIDERYRASAHVTRWLTGLPAADVAGISRIYIISEDSNQDFLGHYLPFLSVITVAWTTLLHPYVPLQWLLRVGNEITFYHEVGHHRHQHSESGQVPEQEKEANDYAKKHIQRAHPLFSKAVNFAKSLLGSGTKSTS